MPLTGMAFLSINVQQKVSMRMPKDNSQKFIARNRALRVQIEYDVEIYGNEKNRVAVCHGSDGGLIR